MLDSFNILLVQIAWNEKGGLYWLPVSSQLRVFKQLGRANYIKLPKPGTNPRGVEITKEAMLSLIKDTETRVIPIFWQKQKIEFNPYKRWVDLWREE